MIIPVSAVKHAIPSLGPDNIINLHGHYVHDEHHSPFASFLYDRPKEELEAEQTAYLQKMEDVRNKWGAWDFHDHATEIRPIANFDKTEYKDMLNSKFPKKSWQMDESYCKSLMDEGRKLIHRVREGIYAEYGHPTEGLNEEEIQARNELFKVHITDSQPRGAGVAWITQQGFDMLTRKLLHGMITNDEFYYIMGGHSAAAGHGNNFHQQYTMQFANIMEPIFHKLGMRLIARNLAMGGLGTLHYSFGASTLYGETDFLMWDSLMTERNPADMDLFHKQAMLGGERIPILFDGKVGNLKDETGGMLWYGERMKAEGLMPITTGLAQAETLPLATRYQTCEPGVDLCSDRNNPNKYTDSCWEPRSDYTPTTSQMAHVGGQAGWHPGDRNHQFNSRKNILLFLDAFDNAFDVWEEGIKSDGFPLNESYWHVGTQYKTIRNNLVESINDTTKAKTACQERMAAVFPELEKACRIPLSGMSQFTPINLGLEGNSITKYVKSAPNGYHPRNTMVVEPAYTGVDILPLIWKIPDDQIDLHAIAIASTYAAPELDHSIADEDDEDAEEAEDARRMLRTVIMGNMDIDRELDPSHSDITPLPPMNESPERILSDAVVPGLGWERSAETLSTTGYCDGSPMSTCKRNPNFNCLLYAHNDNHGTLNGNGLSGWLVITIPKVKYGLVFAKLQWWSPRAGGIGVTKGWTEVNNGVDLEGGGNRNLKAPPKDWPTDFKLDVAVNGKIIKTYTYEEYKEYTKEMSHNEAFYPLLNDDTLGGDESVEIELGLRIRSESSPLDASFGITHIYYG